jgi:tRNA(Ile)-lysidine synthase
MAMMHLSVAAGLKPAIVTVDHGLRPESAAEAAMVARVAKSLGLSHQTLRWQGWDHSGNLQDQARKARRRLMAEWAQSKGIAALALAHTQDDVAETFVMRLARGAGVDGLAAMSAVWAEGGVTWVRPMLAMARDDLRAWLTTRGLTWAEDPSNQNLRYERVKARQTLPLLHPLGLTAARLAGVAAHLAEARVALDALADDWAERCLRPEAGTVLILPQLWQAPAETQRRLLTRIILWIAPAAYGPRGAQIGQLAQRLSTGQAATLAGCRFVSTRQGLRALREASAAAPRTGSPLWDGRWRVTGPTPQGAEIGALTAEGLIQCPDWRATGLPRAALLTSPAVWLENHLIAAPLARFGSEAYSAIPLQPLLGRNSAILSH